MTHSLQIIASRSAGGAERFYQRLVNSLFEQGVRTEAVLPPSSVLKHGLDPRIARHFIPMRAVWDLLAMYRIRRVVDQTDPPIVQTWMGRATRLTRLGKHSNAVHVARLGGYYDVSGYRHADAWIGNTRGICDYLIRNGLPGRSVFHIGNFYEAEGGAHDTRTATRVGLNVHSDDLLVLSTGRLHPNKGFSDLLEAITLLPERIGGRRVRFVILGDGPLRSSLRAQALTLGLGERVSWAGWVDNPGPYYEAADLFVCPSIHEPLGNVILEAWYYGVAIVTTANQGASELVADGHDAMVAPVEDAKGLAAAMVSALSKDKSERTVMANNGRQTLQRSHSKQAVTQAYIDLYGELAP